MSDGPDLTKENLSKILALDWQAEHKDSRTYLTRKDHLVGIIIIDWAWRAIIYTHKNSPDIELRIRAHAQEEYFDAMRLVEAESSAIDDIIRPDRGCQDLNTLFKSIDTMHANGKSPASVFAFAWRGLGDAWEHHYALIEFDNNTGFKTHVELKNAILELESATRMSDLFGIKKAKNKIAFIVKSVGVYHRVIEVARLRDGDGWTWDVDASIFTGQPAFDGDSLESMPFHCKTFNCTFNGYLESWTLNRHGSYVAAAYRVWQEHKRQHPRCEGHLNF